jgi:hypothetical protein
VTDHLRALGDRDVVLNHRGDPLLLNLFAGRAFEPPGTIYYKSKWLLYDQIVVSPGLLEGTGWACEPQTAEIVATPKAPGGRRRGPWRFGDANFQGPRGYSDHLPVTVRLKAQGR